MSEQSTVSAPPPHVHDPKLVPVSEQDQPTWELLRTCVHCGLCLNHCPTYKTLGMEMDSPRGRIYQVLQVNEGQLAMGESFATHIDRCLGCLACEIACPSGVKYGRIVERARSQIEQKYHRPFFQKKVRDIFYRSIIPNYGRLKSVAGLMRFYQRSGLQSLARATGITKLMGVAEVEKLSPRIDSEFFFSEIGKSYPAVGERRGKVAFLAGCINNVAFSHLNHATVNVLTQNGIEVHIPAGQGCCGALHAHAGYRNESRDLARNNIRVFLGGDYDAIVTNAAGCGSHMKEYDDLLEHDPEFAGRAKQFRDKVRDVTEYLAGIGLREPKKKLGRKVAYQDPCHLANAQRIKDQPRALLKAIGCELIELPHQDQCCGSAGVYNVLETELSLRILAAKMDDVQSVESEIIATANVGCMIQLRAGMEQRGLKQPVRHVMELLEEAYS